jgi:hypothetical protein
MKLVAAGYVGYGKQPFVRRCLGFRWRYRWPGESGENLKPLLRSQE